MAAIGSGAPYATAAAKALLAYTGLSAREIAEGAMQIASELCVFTNNHYTVVVAGGDAGESVAIETPLLAPMKLDVVDEDDEDDEDDEEDEEEETASKDLFILPEDVPDDEEEGS